MQLNPYLFFNGNCETAFKFYERAFGGNIESIQVYAGSPGERGVPPEWQDKVLHARMTVGKMVLMASDAPPGRYSQPQGFSMSLNLDKAAEAERIFHALAENGKVIMPIAETFWAERFGMVTDQFGIPWMVNCDKAM
jgi:PhnB protein